MTWQPGDIVRHVAGGGRMTVIEDRGTEVILQIPGCDQPVHYEKGRLEKVRITKGRS